MSYDLVTADPEFRRYVQDNRITQAFFQPLMPKLLFRQEFQSSEWGEAEGLTKIDTRRGLMEPDASPVDGEPDTDDFSAEQWTARLYPFGKATDVDMPSSVNAAVNMFNEKLASLGQHAGMSLNRVARNQLYRAALAGHTRLASALVASTSVSVRSLNGFTHARNPNLAGGEPVRYDPVSASNPLNCTLYNGTVEEAVQIVGYTAADPTNDVYLTGPGTLTLAVATSAPLGAYLVAVDASKVIRPGGAKSTYGMASNARLRFGHFRAATSFLNSNDVPTHPDGYFHCHSPSDALTQFYDDPEMQRLHTSLPESLAYRNMVQGILFNTVFYVNEECPSTQRVRGGNSWSRQDPFAGETQTSASGEVLRPLVTGYGGFIEYYQDPARYVSEAGIQGVMRRMAQIQGNGNITITLPQERVIVIIRAPQDRFQQKVGMAWKAVLGPTSRTDGAVNLGSNCRHKRQVCLETVSAGI